MIILKCIYFFKREEEEIKILHNGEGVCALLVCEGLAAFLLLRFSSLPHLHGARRVSGEGEALIGCGRGRQQGLACVSSGPACSTSVRCTPA